MASNDILCMVKCEVCFSLNQKPCIMASKSDIFFKHDAKQISKDMSQFKVKAREQYAATNCKHYKKL